MQGSCYFSPDYRTARNRFLDAARVVGGIVECFPNPLGAADGGLLSMDVALIGPIDASRTLVVSSGAHGVEGFAGSAIQTGLLEEGIASRLPADTNVFMIHALNPYGMSYLRRFTEDNVDLNRNFMDHAGPHPRNRSYEALADVIAPTSLSAWSELRAWSRLIWYVLTVGMTAAQEAVSGGQYSHPDGLFFGGTFETWSNTTVRMAIRRSLSRAARVVLVDIHTGLGKSGALEVIMNVPERAPEYERAVTIWGHLVKTTATHASSSAPVEAPFKLAIAGLLPDAEVTAAGLEFGTVPAMRVFRAVRAENWLHHHADPRHPAAREVKDRLLRTFYPDADRWKIAVWKQGKEAIDSALAFLAR